MFKCRCTVSGSFRSQASSIRLWNVTMMEVQRILLFAGVVISGANVNKCKTGKTKLCNRFKGLPDSGKKLCLERHDIFKAMLDGIEYAGNTCRKIRKHYPWACNGTFSKHEFRPANGGTKEDAKINAVMSYGMAEHLLEQLSRGTVSHGDCQEGGGPSKKFNNEEEIHPKIVCDDAPSIVTESVRAFFGMGRRAKGGECGGIRLVHWNVEFGLRLFSNKTEQHDWIDCYEKEKCKENKCHMKCRKRYEGLLNEEGFKEILFSEKFDIFDTASSCQQKTADHLGYVELSDKKWCEGREEAFVGCTAHESLGKPICSEIYQEPHSAETSKESDSAEIKQPMSIRTCCDWRILKDECDIEEEGTGSVARNI